MSDFITRLRVEMSDLDEKILKLQDFIIKGKPDNIEVLDWQLLEDQLIVMKTYSCILSKRLFRLTGSKN